MTDNNKLADSSLPKNPASPWPHAKWFAEIIEQLVEVIDYTETVCQIPGIDPVEILEALAAMRDHASLLETEADCLQIIFQDAVRFVEKLRAQRDEAIAERNRVLTSRERRD